MISAGGGTRTRTSLSEQGILSPLRLPFRHAGSFRTSHKLWTWRTLPLFKMMCKVGRICSDPVGKSAAPDGTNLQTGCKFIPINPASVPAGSFIPIF
jgi:hypothetical protein